MPLSITMLQGETRICEVEMWWYDYMLHYCLVERKLCVKLMHNLG